MYGEWVTVSLGDDIECRVFVTCIPRTPEEELQKRAWEILLSCIEKKKKERDETKG